MLKVEFYGYASCSSCRNAEALLNRLGVDFLKRDLFRDKLTSSELGQLFSRVGLSPQAALSRRSRPYAALRLAELTLTDGEIIRLMSEYPALIRRPIVVYGATAVLGYDPAAIERMVG